VNMQMHYDVTGEPGSFGESKERRTPNG